MDRITSYRDLVVWQKAMSLVEECYRLTDAFPGSERFGLTAQMRRAAISVPSNIGEGHSRHHGKEFAQFLYVASGSLSELETQLEVARRLNYLANEDAERLNTFCDEIGKMLMGLRKAIIRHQKSEHHLAPNTSTMRCFMRPEQGAINPQIKLPRKTRKYLIIWELEKMQLVSAY
jgi:four helix bundle protein